MDKGSAGTGGHLAQPTHSDRDVVLTQFHGASSLPLDFDRYRSLLDESEMSREEEDELLTILWRITESFARIGYGLESPQNSGGDDSISTWIDSETTLLNNEKNPPIALETQKGADDEHAG